MLSDEDNEKVELLCKIDTLETMLAEAKAIIQDLLQYVQHKPLCEHNDTESPMCTCGLSKIDTTKL